MLTSRERAEFESLKRKLELVLDHSVPIAEQRLPDRARGTNNPIFGFGVHTLAARLAAGRYSWHL